MNADLITQRALDRHHQVGFGPLSEREKTLVSIWVFEAKVGNGGLAHFFRSTEPELARYVPTAYRAIGIDFLAQLAEEAIAAIGREPVPAGAAKGSVTVTKEAQAKFDELERKYFEYSNDLEDELERYLERTGGSAE